MCGTQSPTAVCLYFIYLSICLSWVGWLQTLHSSPATICIYRLVLACIYRSGAAESLIATGCALSLLRGTKAPKLPTTETFRSSLKCAVYYLQFHRLCSKDDFRCCYCQKVGRVGVTLFISQSKKHLLLSSLTQI